VAITAQGSLERLHQESHRAIDVLGMFAPVTKWNTCIISNGRASMGIAVPGGLAADLAVDANVVAATGDGGFLMNAAEIETATRLGAAYTIVVVNDDYGLISEKQTSHTGESFGTGLTNPDLPAFAESFGIAGHRPTTPDELREAFTTAVGSDAMHLIEMPVA
jgi:acetolactate synthase-1/2/3 large subunit